MKLRPTDDEIAMQILRDSIDALALSMPTFKSYEEADAHFLAHRRLVEGRRRKLVPDDPCAFQLPPD